ncbi:MAG: hypothetical protein ABIJ84_03615 [bacterium]
MPEPNPENREIEISPREKLRLMELEGKYVFHGSAGMVDILEPSQPHSFEESEGKMKKHGDPSVCASGFADVAIFTAIINSKNFPKNHFSAYGVREDGTLHFETTRDILENVKSKKGFVYVLDKTDFKEFEDSTMELRSVKKTTPEEVVEVATDDLPPNIDIKNK